MELWRRASLPAEELEKRLTEFQLLIGPDYELLGAIGLQIDGKQGRVHSEALTHPELEDEHRAELLGRLQNVARNHGLVRLWTQETAPFWKHSGFTEVTPEAAVKRPASFGAGTQPWLAHQLREENPAVFSIEKDFEVFQMQERENSERMLRQARVMKWVAGLVALALFMLVIYFVAKVAQNRARLQKSPSGLAPM